MPSGAAGTLLLLAADPRAKPKVPGGGQEKLLELHGPPGRFPEAVAGPSRARNSAGFNPRC